ncbi:Ubiquitin carboxyl-terminal hydrolase 14 [Smittium culicis]|uniref:ubiquitinyl hydrolase 1 n=1 Tax=Smittium culicis TaxID=133412 RepID=A0A1R1YRT0_9FUNG|nr:Ubiquitin carboxyl-terminal hydrolase 14 [Smittium culicis]
MTTICPHLNNYNVKTPSSNSLIYKDECTLCFDTDDEPEERAKKITKLEIIESSEKFDENSFEISFALKCFECGVLSQEISLDENVERAIRSVKSSLSATKKSEVHSWVKENQECDHLISLQQDPEIVLKNLDMLKCTSCEKIDNLWLCLECGSIGCGRRQYDGSGGNNHAINHFDSTGHKASVKLGTIEPNGSGDVYCYICDDNRLDKNLPYHLKIFGIDVESQLKTEKGMNELELEQNLKLDFSMVSDDGRSLEPLCGPGLTGLINMGNSCYLSSAVISLFNLHDFSSIYSSGVGEHYLQCSKDSAALCLTCQLFKLYDGIFSGRYSFIPSTNNENSNKINGISPRMFKDVLSKGNSEFSQMRQQDSFEFFQYMIKNIRVSEKAFKPSQDSTSIFDFYLEEKLKCTACNCVRVNKQLSSSLTLPVLSSSASFTSDLQEVQFINSFKEFFSDEIIDGYSCSNCKKNTPVLKSFKFLTFPKVLVIQMRRFTLVNWVPTKIENPVKLDNDFKVDLDQFRTSGLRPDEELMPEEKTEDEEPVDLDALSQLVSAGFPEDWCKYSLLIQGNNASDAMNYLVENIDMLCQPAPLDSLNKKNINDSQAPSYDSSLVQTLTSMGFSEDQSTYALNKTDGDVERAIDFLFSHAEEIQNAPISEVSQSEIENPIIVDSEPAIYELNSFISHKGKSVHSGHYVAHAKKSNLTTQHIEWVLFNDDRVVGQPDPPVESAYVYFLTRE